MQKLLEISSIELKFEASDWTDAVKKAGALLVENGNVEPRYVEAMVETVKKLGPYIVIAPGLAMPHAKHSDGVIKSGLSVVTLKNPIEFGNADNDPVSVLIGLAGVNDGMHLKILQAIATIFEEENMLHKIVRTENRKDVMELFNSIEGVNKP